MKYLWKRDCRAFIGKYACDVLRNEGYKSCEECKFYDPIKKKILIIKLGAIGDVLRTTPILTELRKKYSESIHITWLVEEQSKDFLINNPYIDKILVYNFENILRLRFEKFDVLISLEVDTPATLVSNLINAKEKYGYYFANDGFTSCFNKSAELYLERVFSDYINKTNTKSCQEMMFEVAELHYNKQEYMLNLIEKEKEYAKEFMKKNKLKDSDKILGVNMGSGSRWPSKRWNQDKLMQLLKKLSKDYKILILGGPNEIDYQKELINKCKKLKINAIPNNCKNTLREFMSIVNICNLILTTDTVTLHLAIAFKKKTVALFFSTPPWEIESYGLIKKIVSPLLEKYFYIDAYIPELANSISIQEVYDAIKEIENEKRLSS